MWTYDPDMLVDSVYPLVVLRDEEFGVDELLDRQYNAVLDANADGSSAGRRGSVAL